MSAHIPTTNSNPETIPSDKIESDGPDPKPKDWVTLGDPDPSLGVQTGLILSDRIRIRIRIRKLDTDIRYPNIRADTNTDTDIRRIPVFQYYYLLKNIKILLKSINIHNIYLIIMVNNINFFIVYIKLHVIYILFGYE